MIVYVGKGDMLKSEATAIVIPVNTVGVMGCGLALWLKNRRKDIYLDYRKKCLAGEFKIGDILIYNGNTHDIILFPTKKDWSAPSEVDYIRRGVMRLRELAVEGLVYDAAIPALGCGYGELDIHEDGIIDILFEHLDDLDNSFEIYTAKK